MKKLSILNFFLLIGIGCYLILSKQTQAIIPELTTERLNIVGENGNLYAVISSPKRQALATINGKPINPENTERNIAGLLFFNQEGDEVGGLVYGIDSTESYQLLTFDQHKNDQIMALRKDEYLEEGEWKKQYGLLLQERSEKPSNIAIAELNAIQKIEDSIVREEQLNTYYENPENLAPQRLFIGRTYSGNVGLYLMDKSNKLRMQIYVDKEGNPHIESFDATGTKKIIE